MTPEISTHKKGRIFYGWFALAGAMLVIMIVGGVVFNTFGVFLPILCDEFGWSRGSTSLAMSVGMLGFGLPGLLHGALVSRYGPRINLILGNLVAALGVAGLALVQDLWHFYALYVLIGLGGGLGGFIAGSSVANNWFAQKRSLALGMFMACGGLGGFILPPLTTALIDSIGWRMSFVVLGSLVLLLAVVIGGIGLVRNRPEDMGLLPDGADPGVYTEAGEVETPSEQAGQQKGLLKEVLRVRVTYIIALINATAAFTLGTMLTHQIAYIQDIGFDAMTAATTLSVISICSLIGSLSFGALALKWNTKYLAASGFVLQLIALTLLLSSRNIALVYIYSAFLGLGNGTVLPAVTTLVSSYFQRHRYARVMGFVSPFQVIAQGSASYVAGAIFDINGDYRSAFYIVAVMCVVGLVSVFMARRPKWT